MRGSRNFMKPKPPRVSSSSLVLATAKTAFFFIFLSYFCPHFFLRTLGSMVTYFFHGFPSRLSPRSLSSRSLFPPPSRISLPFSPCSTLCLKAFAFAFPIASVRNSRNSFHADEEPRGKFCVCDPASLEYESVPSGGQTYLGLRPDLSVWKAAWKNIDEEEDSGDRGFHAIT